MAQDEGAPGADVVQELVPVLVIQPWAGPALDERGHPAHGLEGPRRGLAGALMLVFSLVGLVVGVPIGVVLGRVAWEAVADPVGVATEFYTDNPLLCFRFEATTAPAQGTRFIVERLQIRNGKVRLAGVVGKAADVKPVLDQYGPVTVFDTDGKIVLYPQIKLMPLTPSKNWKRRRSTPSEVSAISSISAITKP